MGRRTLVLVIAVALAAISGFAIYTYLSNVEDDIRADIAEVGVYVAAAAQGRRVGHALLEAAIASAEAAGLWTLTAGIFPENEASLALHERCGFRRVGVRERIGRGQGRWRDVIWLERRSATVGID